jgi:carnitine 3-dehydrogenase
LRLIGVDLAYVEAGQSYYTVETHIRHLGEAKLGQAIHSTCQILAVDEKRLHLFHTICDTESGAVLATAEQMLLHVDSEAGKATPAPAAVLDKANAIAAAHSKLPPPEGAGRHVGQKR